MLSADGTGSSAKAQAVTTLKQLGKAAVPSLIQALAHGGDTQPLISPWQRLSTPPPYHSCCQALSSGNPVVIRGIVAAPQRGEEI